MNWTDNSNITISGFSGMVIPDDVIHLLPIAGGNDGEQLFGMVNMDDMSQGYVPYHQLGILTILLRLFSHTMGRQVSPNGTKPMDRFIFMWIRFHK